MTIRREFSHKREPFRGIGKLVFEDFCIHFVNTVGEPFLAPVGQYVFTEIRIERSILPPGAKNGSPTVFLKHSKADIQST